jgi:uncharacterized protein with HEPN domain
MSHKERKHVFYLEDMLTSMDRIVEYIGELELKLFAASYEESSIP